jgi:hypothetical protein
MVSTMDIPLLPCSQSYQLVTVSQLTLTFNSQLQLTGFGWLVKLLLASPAQSFLA